MTEERKFEQRKQEERIAELAKNLSPEAQEKAICFMEGLKLASLTENRSA